MLSEKLAQLKKISSDKDVNLEFKYVQGATPQGWRNINGNYDYLIIVSITDASDVGLTYQGSGTVLLSGGFPNYSQHGRYTVIKDVTTSDRIYTCYSFIAISVTVVKT